MEQRSPDAPLPALTRAAPLAAVQPPAAVAALGPERFQQLVPANVTRREKQAGKELAYRLAVQGSLAQLHYNGALTIGRMHDHTHQCLVAGIVSMDARVRAIADPDDQAEIAQLTREQKAMYQRHQFGLLEAAVYGVAKEAEREFYQAPERGLKAWIQEKLVDR